MEASNKNIKKFVRKIVDSHIQWHEKLLYALLSFVARSERELGKLLIC